MRISDWSSDVCSSDLAEAAHRSALKIYWERGRRKDRHRRSGEQRGIERRCRSPPSRILPCMGRPGMAASTVPSIRAHGLRSEEHTSELQSLMRISYAVFCLKKKIKIPTN